MSGPLLESRSFRPFKSSEEYLYAMKEDLAEWFQTLYPHLRICTENFMQKLETGVALCEHANAVKVQAAEYVKRKQAKMMTKSVTSAQILLEIGDVKYFATAKSGTFFARDNLSNFIQWCRVCLKILDCLLFESDDLILRKNEKHVILCLLEVARIGARYGMLAPMLVQMERQIDREIAADQRRNMENWLENQNTIDEDETDSEMEDEQPMMIYGPLPQIITNDLKSLDEMVRDLVEKCTCPTQFPMIRVSEGKYRIGDTKVLIFVRILRNHVMVRVGGGWDTLSHYLDKHDPCRCRAQHRTTQGARLVSKQGVPDLQGAQVYYDRSGSGQSTPNGTPHNSPNKTSSLLGPPMNSLNRSRSRSPGSRERRSVSPYVQRKNLLPPQMRSRSPTPNFVSTHTQKLRTHREEGPNVKNHVAHLNFHIPEKMTIKTETSLQVSGDSNTDHSDNTSEVSDEGYRSLGIIGDKNKNNAEDAEDVEHHHDSDEERNECGLRKTQHSAKMYGEKSSISRQNSAERKIPPQKSSNSRRNSLTQIDSPKVATKPQTVSKMKTVNNTWNGRQRTPRPTLTNETFIHPNLNRSSPGRRSISASKYERRGSNSNSSATSPTKNSLKDEIMEVVCKAQNEDVIVKEVKKLLNQYSNLNPQEDSKSKMRKDSKPENQISRIPAPIPPHRI